MTCGPPYGEWGSRKYVLDSLDQSLSRMRLDHVDIFYSHRFDPETPLEETMGALHSAVQTGKTRYVGISSYGPPPDRGGDPDPASARNSAAHPPAVLLAAEPLVEEELLEVVGREGVGVIASRRSLRGCSPTSTSTVYRDSRVRRGLHLGENQITPENVEHAASSTRSPPTAPDAGADGDRLELRDPRVTSALVGASSVSQLEQNLGALDRLDFDQSELEQIDRYAVEGHIDIWATSSEA